MHRNTIVRFVRIGLVAGLLIVAGAAGAAETDPNPWLRYMPSQITEEWEGTWDVSVEARDCDSGVLLFSDEYESYYCAGMDFNPTDEDDIECTGDITPTAMNIVCTYQGVVTPDCTANTTVTIAFVMGVGTYSGTQTILNEFVGDCGVDSTCIEMTVSAMLVDPDPDECEPQAGDRVDWGGLKAIYR